MLPHIHDWLARRGFPADIEISAMAPGLGHTAMWRITGGVPAGDLAVRLFPAGDDLWRDREVLAMRAARAAGLPVPAVLATDTIAGRPTMLTTFVPGASVAAAIAATPDQAPSIGQRLGRLLGELNRLPAPTGLAPASAWLDRAGPALAPLRDRLAAMPDADRLLHLDFHPENVLIDGDAVTGILDWTNTLPGPPHIDLGRSRAILRMIRLLPTIAPDVAQSVASFETGLIDGHAELHGPDPASALSLAWGVGMLCVDFAPQAGVPGGWVTPGLVARLEAERDRLIARALDDAEV